MNSKNLLNEIKKVKAKIKYCDNDECPDDEYGLLIKDIDFYNKNDLPIIVEDSGYFNDFTDAILEDIKKLELDISDGETGNVIIDFSNKNNPERTVEWFYNRSNTEVVDYYDVDLSNAVEPFINTLKERKFYDELFDVAEKVDNYFYNNEKIIVPLYASCCIYEEEGIMSFIFFGDNKEDEKAKISMGFYGSDYGLLLSAIENSLDVSIKRAGIWNKKSLENTITLIMDVSIEIDYKNKKIDLVPKKIQSEFSEKEKIEYTIDLEELKSILKKTEQSNSFFNV